MTPYLTDTDRLAARAANIALALRVLSGRLRASGPCNDALIDLNETIAALDELLRDVAAIVEVQE